MRREGFPSLRGNFITYFLLISNIVLFFVCTVKGEALYNVGGLYAPAVLEKHEYYRLLTSIFLHYGIGHITSNMLTLGAVGFLLEEKIGHVRYAICYFGAGIGGGCFSIFYATRMGKNSMSVGASGAIFGLLGVLLYLVVANHGTYEDITIQRVIFAIILSVYIGVSSTGVDNAAHIGGLFAGFVLMTVLGMFQTKGRGRR